MKRLVILLIVLVGLVVEAPTGGAVTLAQEPVVEPAHLSAMRYRNIGPHRGGRVTAVEGVPEEPFTFYRGGSGGVWRTTNAGMDWMSVSDGFFEVGSIGAIEVADSDPNVIYVGTGSGCIRGDVSVGIGLYKSTDSARTWPVSRTSGRWAASWCARATRIGCMSLQGDTPSDRTKSAVSIVPPMASRQRDRPYADGAECRAK